MVVFDQSWIATPELGPAQAPVQDVDAQAHDQMHTAPGLVCSDRPEGCLLSCFDPSATQTVPTVCVRGSGMAVQGPPLRALPVPPCLQEGRGGQPLPLYGKWASGSSTVSSMARAREQLCDHRDLVLRHLSQLGLRVNWEKSKLSPAQRISFLGVELDSVSMTARLTEERAQSVLNCLSSFRGRTVVPLKQFQRLLGHMASAVAVTPLGLLHMRPLQHWLHSRVPRWGMAPRCTSGEHHTGVSPLLQPLDGPCLSTGRGALRTSVLACCCHNRCLQHGLGCYMQRAGSLGALDRASTALAHQLPRAVGSASGLAAVRPLLLGKHVLVHTDNTAAVSYINRMGGI